MKPKFLLLIMAIGYIINAFSQSTIELTFSSIEDTTIVQIDSIKVINRTQGGDTALYYPDTVLVIDYQIGIPEINNEYGTFKLLQNYPNPVVNQALITLYVPEKDIVKFIVTDLAGHELIVCNQTLDHGFHQFKYTTGTDSFTLLIAIWRNKRSSIKIMQNSTIGNAKCDLEYLESVKLPTQHKSSMSVSSFPFNVGDELIYTGYYDTLQSSIINTPITSDTHRFQFAYNIPCHSTPILTYGGQNYNTVQVFNQCWIKENLNYELGGSWWAFNDSIYGEKYGRVYTWNSATNACPEGWHLPTDNDWKILEINLGMTLQQADSIGNRGTDEGTKLKASSGWVNTSNGTDIVGFSALPGGGRGCDGEFWEVDYSGWWWSATEFNSENSWYRSIVNENVHRNYFKKNCAYSVRCLKD